MAKVIFGLLLLGGLVAMLGVYFDVHTNRIKTKWGQRLIYVGYGLWVIAGLIMAYIKIELYVKGLELLS